MDPTIFRPIVSPDGAIGEVRSSDPLVDDLSVKVVFRTRTGTVCMVVLPVDEVITKVFFISDEEELKVERSTIDQKSRLEPTNPSEVSVVEGSKLTRALIAQVSIPVTQMNSKISSSAGTFRGSIRERVGENSGLV